MILRSLSQKRLRWKTEGCPLYASLIPTCALSEEHEKESIPGHGGHSSWSPTELGCPRLVLSSLLSPGKSRSCLCKCTPPPHVALKPQLISGSRG